jgi:hypothetical protein
MNAVHDLPSRSPKFHKVLRMTAVPSRRCHFISCLAS